MAPARTILLRPIQSLRAGSAISGAAAARSLRPRVPKAPTHRPRIYLGQSAAILKDLTMRPLKLAALLLGLAALAAGGGARAQEFRIEEATSPAELAVDRLKPRTIAFIDRPNDELIDPDTGLIRFEDWAQ